MATRAHGQPLPRWQRSLLPAMLGADRADRGQSGGSTLPRTLRDWLVDIVFFLGALGFAAATALSDSQHNIGVLLDVDIALALPAIGLLWIRRRRPLLVGLVAIGASFVSNAAGAASIAALFTVAIYCPPRRTAQLATLSLASDVVVAFLYEDHGHDRFQTLLFGVFATIVAVVFGAFVRVRRELVLSLRERNRRLQADQERRVAEAQRAERNRIAREMHDVLAHRISLLSVHAGALEFNPDASPEEIARAARVIRESARAAQEELREVIGVLRSEPAGDDSVEPPQPTLTDLDRLVAESQQAGMEVRLAMALEPGLLPPMLGRTVYRVVQEALTNVRKHAPGQVVAVVVAGGPLPGVRVSVTNQPAVGHAGAAAPDGQVGSGAGLIGLRERVALAGGTLEHEPLPGGGFRLSATLPWTPEPAMEPAP